MSARRHVLAALDKLAEARDHLSVAGAKFPNNPAYSDCDEVYKALAEVAKRVAALLEYAP